MGNPKEEVTTSGYRTCKQHDNPRLSEIRTVQTAEKIYIDKW